jgi:hypothetical protein
MEIKKLVYVYLMRYAEEQQDLALLSIATFQRGLKVNILQNKKNKSSIIFILGSKSINSCKCFTSFIKYSCTNNCNNNDVSYS